MREGLREGRNPRSVALDLVGRINRASGRREGGVIGLLPSQQEQAASVRDALLSNNKTGMEAYLNRKLRDRRFDSMVRKAIRGERKLKVGEVERIVGRLKDRMLKWRGDMIGRTEMLQSLHAAQHEALTQYMEAGRLPPETITREWDASEDADTRDSHRAMEGQTVGPDEAFTTGDGHRLMHPGDRSLGAPAEEIINCRCRVRLRIDFIAAAARGNTAA